MLDSHYAQPPQAVDVYQPSPLPETPTLTVPEGRGSKLRDIPNGVCTAVAGDNHKLCVHDDGQQLTPLSLPCTTPQ